MPKLKLTDAAVAKFKLPPAPEQVDHWDTLTPAFGIRVSYSGAKAWLVAVRILTDGQWKKTRISFGRYPDMSLADARTAAQEIKLRAKKGENPRLVTANDRADLEAKSRDTFASVRDKFIKQHCQKKLRPRPAKEYERVLRSADFKDWETRPITEITKRDVIALLDTVAERAPVHANRTLLYLRKMMNWAASRDILEHPPTDRVAPPTKEVMRDRALSNDEVALLWRALENVGGVFGPLFKLLLLTGQRREEVAQMRWSELKDLKGLEPMWEIPRERVKMDRPQRVPLSAIAVKIINSLDKIGDEFVFTTTGTAPVSGFSRAKERVDREIAAIIKKEKLTGLFAKDWIIHDLRRTAATHMAEMGISRDVVELILNHRSGTRGGVAGIYNRSELLPERRRALKLWAEHLRSLATGTTRAPRLLPFKRRGQVDASTQ